MPINTGGSSMKSRMNKSAKTGLLLLVLSACIFLAAGEAFKRSTPLGAMDFKVLYFGARCFIHHCDPYNVEELKHFYDASNLSTASDPSIIRYVVTEYVYLPTTFLITGLFATLPWGFASLLWTLLTSAAFITSAVLIWTLCATRAPVLAGCLIGFWLASSTVIFAGGNAVGLAVSCCVIAVWCFLKERWALAGIVCLTISLLLKPHDSGLIWLYFLLAGGSYRKRALQTLALTAVLAAGALLWASQVAPHWAHEQAFNLSLISAHGGMNDPAPGSSVDRTAGLVIDLQSVVSIFRSQPRFYNSVSYAICGILILAWSILTLRLPRSPQRAWLALAAIVPLTLLITYHKPYDAKLLLLTLPACIQLCSGRRSLRNLALLLTSLGIVCTADIPLAVFYLMTSSLHPQFGSLPQKIAAILITRPVTILLLLMALFFLSRYASADDPVDGPPHQPDSPS